MSLRQPKPVVFKGLRPASDAAPIPFELTCACGTSIRGQRQIQSQSVACPSCNAKRFVLPRSPLPEVGVALDTSDGATNSRIGHFFVILAIAAILAVSAGSVIAWIILNRAEPDSQRRQLSDQEQYDRHLAAGRAALGEQSWHKAARELNAAIQLDDRAQRRFSKDGREHLLQQQRQAAIVADLLAESIVEIGRQSSGLPGDEWQQIFRERYSGRSFIIDDVLHRDSAGKFHYHFKLMLQKSEMRLDLGRVTLLKSQLLLNQPQRVLVGLRLAGVRKEATGWTVELDPDGGVWMTDEEMLSGLSVPIDAELREVLRRQKSWVAIKQ